MPVLAALATLLPLTALGLRWWVRERSFGLEALVLTASSWLAVVGLLATALAIGGMFSALPLAGGCTVIGVLLAPWRGRDLRELAASARSARSRESPSGARRPALVATFVLVGIVGLGTLLRLPPIPAPLAGRDQGTYALLAEQLARTGSLSFTDPLLARAGDELGQRAGPADLLGLYDRRDGGARAGVYDGAYRPGLYLADRDRGRVVPQFLHLHPSLLAIGALASGDAGIAAIVALEAVLALLAFAAVSRRLWPRGGWWWLATALAALSPILVWTQRVPLSEGPTLLLGLSATLSLLRARHELAGRSLDEARGFLLLGAMAWTRGNAWIVLPFVLTILLLRPRADRGLAALVRGPWPLWGLGTASVLVHATTSFPYVHDELLRRLPATFEVGPLALVTVALVACVIWIALDLGLARASSLAARPSAALAAALPGALLLGVGCALAYYLASAAGRAGTEGPPFARLDAALPMLGAPLIAVGLAGAAATCLRWRATPADAGILAVMAIPALTVALHCERGLPRFELYYYGRYLVPEILPALVLAAVAGLQLAHDRLLARTRSLAQAFAWTGAFGLVWTTGGVFVTDPGARFRENAEAGGAIERLSAELPDGAIVLAGGEGWHFGHTHNQVGGALALGHGAAVLPYRSQEAAYATLWELLIARPRASGEAPPRVFVLLNEASHNYLRDPDSASAVVVAGIDDQLPAPFRVRRLGLLELFAHALTTTTDRVPSHITRHELRMALLEVEIDPERRTQVEQWSLASGTPTAGASLVLRGAQSIDGGLCLDGDATTEILVPARGEASERPAYLALVAAPGSHQAVGRWQVEVDGRHLAFDAAGMSPRERDTLGPVLVERRPRRITVRGDPHRGADAPCPGGVLAELRVIEASIDGRGVAQADWAVSIAPAHDYGFPYPRSEWVAAKSINRFRPGTDPEPRIDGLAMRLAGGQVLDFAPILAPAMGRLPLDLVVTLSGTRVGPGARLRIYGDDRLLAELDPPDSVDGWWSSPPATFSLAGPTLRVRAELRESDDGEWIGVRDVAVFVRGPTLSATPIRP